MDRFVLKARNKAKLGILLTVAFLLTILSPANVQPVSADPGMLAWSIIDTPSPGLQNNVIFTLSEINALAIGSDSQTFYAADIPAGRVYKSNDGGITWQNELNTQLIAAGAFTPVWNIAIAPDDVNFVVAITDSTGVPGGPKQVYISTDGGDTWTMAVNGLFLAAGEYISCVDVSVTYGGSNRDVAIGTRDGAGNGRVWVLKAAGFGNWNAQDAAGTPPSTNWPGGDVVALKFSPTYPSDSSLVVVSSNATNTQIHLGTRDTANNFTTWGNVVLWDPSFAGNSPVVAEMIIGDLELPSDFSGTDPPLRRFFVSTDTTANQSGVYWIENTVPHLINPPPPCGRISSIAYSGTYAAGTLLAGEVTANPTSAQVNIWRTNNPAALTPTWYKSDDQKSPTGGGNSGYANAQIAFSPDATTAYCGTSSACLGAFSAPTGAVTCAIPPGPGPEWPDGYLNGFALDESAFSVSPYAIAYGQQLGVYEKAQDTIIGNIWNQLSLIDTEMDVLTDVAALQAPQDGEDVAVQDYDILYLFSQNTNIPIATRFNSVWRSTSDPLGNSWERVLCLASDDESILRVRQPSYDEADRSDVIVFGTLGNNLVGYSVDEGQSWNVRALYNVTDIALSGDDTIFILNNILVHMYVIEGTSLVLKNSVYTGLESGHTIAVPVKNPTKEASVDANMVAVGEAGPPLGRGRIVYADFSEAVVTISPPINERIAPPVMGDAHVIFDDHFDENNIIYNAIHGQIAGGGKIYRWVNGKNVWDELQPPNAEFYGLVQRNNVLYGAWKTPQVPAILAYNAGVDRTLYPRVRVPPPPEWDYLVSELLVTVFFDHEPSSLKISSNDYNNLWAIDNLPYNFVAQVGCLWGYADILSKVGPWTTSPPSGSEIPVDPKSGRASEVNFSWRQISYATGYELQIAKDEDFYNRLLVNDNITPVDPLAPTVYFPAGGLISASGSAIGSFGNLESGHTYYWRVRARRAITGEIIRSPWSATMYFTVKAGLPTASPYPTMTLFSPMYGARDVSNTPGFSWSGLPGITKYEFVLARDATLQQVVVKTNVPMTSYLYDGKLDYNTPYFWQVRAIEPVVSDPSPLGTFTVIAEKKPAEPIVEKPASIPSWVWWIIAVFAALMASMIAFTMTKPSYVKRGGGKLFKVEPIVEKPKSRTIDKPKNPTFGRIKNSIVKTWESIVLVIRRQRLLKKSSGSETQESTPKESTSQDSQDNLT